MVEKVGECAVCKKIIYCNNGFLDGIIIDSEVYCFKCAENNEAQNEITTD